MAGVLAPKPSSQSVSQHSHNTVALRLCVEAFDVGSVDERFSEVDGIRLEMVLGWMVRDESIPQSVVDSQRFEQIYERMPRRVLWWRCCVDAPTVPSEDSSLACIRLLTECLATLGPRSNRAVAHCDAVRVPLPFASNPSWLWWNDLWSDDRRHSEMNSKRSIWCRNTHDRALTFETQPMNTKRILIFVAISRYSPLTDSIPKSEQEDQQQDLSILYESQLI